MRVLIIVAAAQLTRSSPTELGCMGYDRLGGRIMSVQSVVGGSITGGEAHDTYIPGKTYTITGNGQNDGDKMILMADKGTWAGVSCPLDVSQGSWTAPRSGAGAATLYFAFASHQGSVIYAKRTLTEATSQKGSVTHAKRTLTEATNAVPTAAPTPTPQTAPTSTPTPEVAYTEAAHACGTSACTPSQLQCDFGTDTCSWRASTGPSWDQEDARSASGDGLLVMAAASLEQGSEAMIYSPVVQPSSSAAGLSVSFNFRLFSAELFVDTAIVPFPTASGKALDTANNDPSKWLWVPAFNYSGTHFGSEWHEGIVELPLQPEQTVRSSTVTLNRAVALRVRGSALAGDGTAHSGGVIIDAIRVGYRSDCEWAEWGPWSATCHPVCGGGQEKREAIIVKASAFGGTSCPVPEYRACSSSAARTACEFQRGGECKFGDSGHAGAPILCQWHSANRGDAAEIGAAGSVDAAGVVSSNASAVPHAVLHEWETIASTSTRLQPMGLSDGDGHLVARLHVHHGGAAVALLLTPALNLSWSFDAVANVSSVVNAQNVILSLKYATRYGASLHIDAQLRTPEQHAWASSALVEVVNGGWWSLWNSSSDSSPKEGTSWSWRARYLSMASLLAPLASGALLRELPLRLRLRAASEHGAPGAHITAAPTVAVDHVRFATAPQDCVISGFLAWSQCTQTCAGGTQTREPNIVTPALFGGTPCLAPETRACNTAIPCPVDCKVSDWGAWSSCSQTCNTGTQDRTRNVTRIALGGAMCPSLKETQSCYQGTGCNADCELSQWSAWGVCSKNCTAVDSDPDAKQSRWRTVTRPAAGLGTACDTTLLETRMCSSVSRCPRDCVMTDWGAWGSCSVTCGGGSQTRTRAITGAAAFGGGCPDSRVSEVRGCNVAQCDVDCSVQAWSEMGVCDNQCNAVGNTSNTTITGKRYRHRAIQIGALGQGNTHECAKLSESQDCVTIPVFVPHCAASENQEELLPPKACELSSWGSWSACSSQCNEGQQVRSRTLNAFGFKGTCGPQVEVRPCNGTSSSCELDCEVSDFGPPTPCTASCGGGLMTLTRSILSYPTRGGAACPEIKLTLTCNSQPCPVDCAVSPWQAWGECTVECGASGGIATRFRAIVRGERHGGNACPALSEQRTCNAHVCTPDCRVTPWSEWGACSVTCGTGTHTRTRQPLSVVNAGVACPPFTETAPCEMPRCAVNCAVSPWVDASACSVSCGGGKKQQSREVTTVAKHGGAPCPALRRTTLCGGTLCPVHCSVSIWSSWDVCDKECAGGTRRRERVIVVPSAHGGNECPALVDTQVCNTHLCPIHCSMTDWSSWSECSATCGYATKSRSRSIITEPQHNGKQCGSMVDRHTCDYATDGIAACPHDCNVSPWGNWGGCTMRNCASGGNVGKRYRFRNVTHSATTSRDNSGSVGECILVTQGQLVEQEDCNSAACNGQQANRNCTISQWGAWGKCSRECGSGTQMRVRTIAAGGGASGAGLECPSPMFETRSCNLQNCPIDCRVTRFEYVFKRREHYYGNCEFGANGCGVHVSWSACDRSCGGGTRVKVRNISTAPLHGGASCPPLNVTEPCNVHDCPVDCVTSPWSPHGQCSKDCGGGQRTEYRTVQVTPKHGGHPCPALNQTQPCNQQPCNNDCQVSLWGSWGQCSQSCNTGSRTRIRNIIVREINDGAPCPVLSEVGSCNSHACPIDCALSDWSAWQACDPKTCRKRRVRSVITAQRNGGVHCAATLDVHDCITCTSTPVTTTSTAPLITAAATTTTTAAVSATNAPVVDCFVSQWSEWGQCTATCNTGASERTRSILLNATNGGAACPVLAEQKACNRGLCAAPNDVSSAANCIMDDWGAWSACTKNCDEGTKTRSRSTAQGWCPSGVPRSESKMCNLAACSTCCFRVDIALKLLGNLFQLQQRVENNMDDFNHSIAFAMGVSRRQILAIVFESVGGRQRRLNAGTDCVVSIRAETELTAIAYKRVASSTQHPLVERLETEFSDKTGDDFSNTFAPVIIASVTHTASEALEQSGGSSSSNVQTTTVAAIVTDSSGSSMLIVIGLAGLGLLALMGAFTVHRRHRAEQKAADAKFARSIAGQGFTCETEPMHRVTGASPGTRTPLPISVDRKGTVLMSEMGSAPAARPPPAAATAATPGNVHNVRGSVLVTDLLSAPNAAEAAPASFAAAPLNPERKASIMLSDLVSTTPPATRSPANAVVDSESQCWPYTSSILFACCAELVKTC